MSWASRRRLGGEERFHLAYALETDWPVEAGGLEPPHSRRPDALAGAGGFEPLHFGIGIRQDSQPGRRDSNLCISKSSKRRIWTVSWSPQAVQWPLHHSRCGSSTPAAPTGQSVSNAYGIGSRSKCKCRGSNPGAPCSTISSSAMPAGASRRALCLSTPPRAKAPRQRALRTDL
jgi:hypothetical protein